MQKYNIIFTLDYEIHGNGDGCSYKLLVDTTERLMSVLESFGARLTILADVAEILRFKQYFKETGEDKFYYKAIEEQLIDAIKRGHDVQLHIHSSYFNAIYNGKKWDQCVEDFNMAALPYERIDEMVRICTEYLNNLLMPIKSNYRCHAFRAAGWSMMPTPNIYRALVKYGIDKDTSVYKWGVQGGNVIYDYREAYSDLLPYRASSENINYYDPNGEITEYPIYTEMRYFWSFVSPMRVFRDIRAKFHKHKRQKNDPNNHLQVEVDKNNNKKISLKVFFVKSAWKFDFNYATSRQMIGALKRVMKRNANTEVIDVVLIGHSKSFIHYNEKTLNRFLKYTSKQNNIVYRSFD